MTFDEVLAAAKALSLEEKSNLLEALEEVVDQEWSAHEPTESEKQAEAEFQAVYEASRRLNEGEQS